jgi:hypothetical protein
MDWPTAAIFDERSDKGALKGAAGVFLSAAGSESFPIKR